MILENMDKSSINDDVIKWKHFSRYWPLVLEPIVSFVFSLMCTWRNGGINTPDAGDLRHHLAHYIVTVMKTQLELMMQPQRNKTQSTSLQMPGLILGLPPANERRRYIVTTSLIGWVQA